MSEAARGREERRITSPEQLHDYIHVTGPSLWLLLVMILILLAGMIVLAASVTIENKLPVQAAASEVTNENGATMLICSVADEQQAQAKIGMTVRVAGEEGTVTEIIDDNQEAFLVIELNRPGAVLKQGTYDAEIVLERTTPISFLLKKE